MIILGLGRQEQMSSICQQIGSRALELQKKLQYIIGLELFLTALTALPYFVSYCFNKPLLPEEKHNSVLWDGEEVNETFMV